MRIKERIITLSGLSSTPHVTAAAITLLLLSGSILAGFVSHKARLQDERIKALGNLGVIRANLEGELNARLLMGQGLVSYVSVKPDMTAGQFRDYSERLVKSDPMIRNISVIRNTTILYAYPLESNRKAIGVDVAKIPSQKDQLFKVINTGNAVVSANVHLVQGGVATICRMPVFTGSGGTHKYWGQVSIVLMQDVLFSEAGMLDSSMDLKYYLATLKDDGSQGGDLYGDSGIMRHEPVTLDIHFPYGSWRIAALPSNGWGYSDSRSVIYASVLTFASLMLGWLVFWIMTLGRRVQQLESLLPVCANCGRIKNDNNEWQSARRFFSEKSAIKVSHGLCPDCTEILYGDQPWFKRRKEKQGE